MNLKEILTHKAEIIEIAKRLGFTVLCIHNTGTGGMYLDKDGNLPLGLVSTTGNLVNNAECCSRLGLLLGCKVDLVTEVPKDSDSFRLKGSVSLEDEKLEEKLVKLFEIPLEEVEFTPLEGVEKYIAEESIRKIDSQTMMFQGPQTQSVTFVAAAQQVEVMVLSLREDFNVFLQQHLNGVPKESVKSLFGAFEQQIYPQAKKHFLDDSDTNKPQILV